MLVSRCGRALLVGIAAGAALAGGSVAVPASAAPATAREWRITPSPHVAEGYGLDGVSCPTATNCVAVGSISVNVTFHSLIETWDGSAWTVTPSPVASPLMYLLSGVSCVDASHCVAVGQTLTNSAEQTLVETYDGTSWTVVPSPNTGYASVLTNVSCANATSCVAVGWYSNREAHVTALIEMWNGVAWTLATMPRPHHTGISDLTGVSCTSPTSCMAVGYGISDVGQQPLAEKWNGTSWLVKPAVNRASRENGFVGVSCTDGNSCTAVGFSAGDNGPLIESWNGASWSVADRPNPGTGGNQLTSVSCPTRTKCVAVGTYNSDKRMQRPKNLVEAWNGTSWSVVRSQSRLNVWESPAGVSCSSTASCTAVGGAYVAPDENGYVLTGRL